MPKRKQNKVDKADVAICAVIPQTLLLRGAPLVYNTRMQAAKRYGSSCSDRLLMAQHLMKG